MHSRIKEAGRDASARESTTSAARRESRAIVSFDVFVARELSQHYCSFYVKKPAGLITRTRKRKRERESLEICRRARAVSICSRTVQAQRRQRLLNKHRHRLRLNHLVRLNHLRRALPSSLLTDVTRSHSRRGSRRRRNAEYLRVFIRVQERQRGRCDKRTRGVTFDIWRNVKVTV